MTYNPKVQHRTRKIPTESFRSSLYKALAGKSKIGNQKVKKAKRRNWHLGSMAYNPMVQHRSRNLPAESLRVSLYKALAGKSKIENQKVEKNQHAIGIEEV